MTCDNPAKCAGSTNAYRQGCHEAPCRAANAAYKRDLRTRSTAERTKTRVVRPSNVVELCQAAQCQTAFPPQHLNSDIPGEQEAAVIARFDQLGTDDAALVARCRAMARLLDDDPTQRVLGCQSANNWTS